MTEERALLLAHNWGLENEIKSLIKQGYEPIEALAEWDLV